VVERARWRGTMNYRVVPRLQVGLEFNLVVEEIGPLTTAFLTKESERVPAIFVGTSSDRIGSPEGEQAYYLTAAKQAPWWPISGYLSLNYSEWDEHLNVPFGLTAWLGENLSVQPMYDGERTHLLLNYNRSQFGISLLWIWLEQAGMAISGGF
jgi:hypothetical protein